VNRRMLASLGIAGVMAPLLARGANTTDRIASYRNGTLTISTIPRRATEIALKRASSPRVREFTKLELAEQITVSQVLTNIESPPYVTLDPADTDAIAHLASLPAGKESVRHPAITISQYPGKNFFGSGSLRALPWAVPPLEKENVYEAA
jgi:hypothetical protein